MGAQKASQLGNVLRQPNSPRITPPWLIDALLVVFFSIDCVGKLKKSWHGRFSGVIFGE